MKLVKENLDMLSPKGDKEIHDAHIERANLERGDLQIGNSYTVFEPGLGEWLKGYKYLGFALNRDEFIFYDDEVADEITLIEVPREDLKGNVVPE